MNIEKQIKDLTDAMIRLTEVMEVKREGNSITVSVPKPDPEDPFDESNHTVITASHVKELAKEKMRSGIDRKTIKDMVTKLKADSIADLDSEGLKTLHKQLGKL
jgi:hypothetical protein|tara:strand:+ start:711 stop:1022 length:312 start_codon:yes stop_codon:yes gene_type:complete